MPNGKMGYQTSWNREYSTGFWLKHAISRDFYSPKHHADGFRLW